jgi:hypothetical protein
VRVVVVKAVVVAGEKKVGCLGKES